MSLHDDLKALSEKVKQFRDQARVQMHLAHEDVTDEWDDLEEDWKRFKNRLDSLLHDTNETPQETSHEMMEAAHKAGSELSAAYKALKDRLR